MIDRVEKTRDYFRKRLKALTKDEIIDGIMASSDFQQIELTVHRCECSRRLKAIQKTEAQEKQKTVVFVNALKEYNLLVAELNSVGIEKFPLEKVNRLAALTEILRKNV